MAYKSPLILGTSGYPAQIQSGDTLSLSSLGTGTANSTTYLRGDGTWATVNTLNIVNTTTNATYYPMFADASSGTTTVLNTSSTKLYFNPSTGTLNATGFNSLSDVNKKKNIETICNATATVLALRGVTYDWKDNNRKSMGVIAQELESVVPYLVDTNETGEKSVLYGNLVGLLIEAIKEQQVEINKLKQVVGCYEQSE